MTRKTSSTEWIPQLSVIRIAACIAIVVLHTVFAANEYFSDAITSGQDTASRIVENNMMWAVPAFLMVTGVLQLDNGKELTLKKLYGKYILRVFAALVLFSLVFRLFDMIMDGEEMTFAGIMKGFYEMLTSSGWGHLWYLYLLIGLYVLMPFYRKIAGGCSDKELTYLAAVYVVFLSLIPLAEKSFDINIGFYISESLIYPLYLFLGHMIHEKRIHGSVKAGIVTTAVSTVLLTALTFAGCTDAAEIPPVLFGYQSPLVILQSAGIFMMLDCTDACAKAADTEAADTEATDTRKNGRNAVIRAVDAATFGIYLIHMVFVRLLFRYMQFDPYSTFSAPLTLAACIAAFFALSCIITVILKKVPGIGRIL